jgi:arylsulfatase A-like enzyme
MLASRYPSELSHSSCGFGYYEIPESLAPVLQSAGITTFAAHGHAIFASNTAPRVGFDVWRLISGAAGRLQANGAVTGADTARLLINYLDKERPKARLFAWIHLVDPHDSYVAHKEFPPLSERPRDVYDSEVAYTDSVIGQMLDAMERLGMRQNTAIVLTSDHGEAFGEHGTKRHGFTLYEEEVRVPLMLYLPGVEPRTIDEPRSALDVAPTVAELLATPVPKSWRGVSLLEDIRESVVEARPVLIDVPAAYSRSGQQAVVRGNTKVIFRKNSTEVFDLAKDPEERAPLSTETASDAIELSRADLKRIQSVPETPCKGGGPKAAP